MPARSRTFQLAWAATALFAFAGMSLASEKEEHEPERCKPFGNLETPHKIFGNKAEIDPVSRPHLTLEERHERAGNPQCVSRFADWSFDKHYDGYYVGGGNPYTPGKNRPWSPEPRNYYTEGTWGWDYAPPWSRVRLGWWHGRRYEDGEGQYEANKHSVNPFSPNFGPWK
jgi:hypothetical protein